MTKIRKIPMRTCIGCREQKAKKDLIRVVKNKEDEIFIKLERQMEEELIYVMTKVVWRKR